MGMRASTGAIAEVRRGPGGLVVPRARRRPAARHLRQRAGGRRGGGSGTRRHRSERAAGRGGPWMLSAPVSLTQSDVRELQLAKAAIAAGIRILLGRWGAPPAACRAAPSGGRFRQLRAAGRAPGASVSLPFPEKWSSRRRQHRLARAPSWRCSRDAGDFARFGARIEHVPLGRGRPVPGDLRRRDGVPRYRRLNFFIL